MPLSPEKLKLLQTAFRPHAAIEDPASFFGRETEHARLVEAISEPGLQVVVYGEPGCGKTSLANVASNGVPQIKVFCEKDADFARLLRDMALEFQKRDPEHFIYDANNDTLSVKGVVLPLTKLTGNNILNLLPAEGPFCIILDELDRVEDLKAIAALAELAKNVATNRPHVTLIMVGVGDTAGTLFKGHTSNFRNILEVPLDRMDEAGLIAILEHGEQVLKIKFVEEVKQEILQMCDRMPYYLHLLAKNAAKAALIINAPTVEPDDLVRGSIEAAAEADQQLRDVYDRAVFSKQNARIYQKVLWALANLPNRANNVADITEQANKITFDENEKAVSQQAVRNALRRLLNPEKGSILTHPRSGAYGFTSPLMKGFIRLLRYQR